MHTEDFLGSYSVTLVSIFPHKCDIFFTKTLKEVLVYVGQISLSSFSNMAFWRLAHLQIYYKIISTNTSKSCCDFDWWN